MMAVDQAKRESRSIKFLLWKYETKQPGEVNNSRFMEEWRDNKRVRFALNEMEVLNVVGPLKDQVIWIIENGPSTKKLCARCSCETVTLAIIFYIKFSNTKKRPLTDYKLAREYGLTEEIYSNILTKLSRFFQEKMALTGRIKQQNK